VRKLPINTTLAGDCRCCLRCTVSPGALSWTRAWRLPLPCAAFWQRLARVIRPGRRRHGPRRAPNSWAPLGDWSSSNPQTTALEPSGRRTPPPTRWRWSLTAASRYGSTAIEELAPGQRRRPAL